MANQLGPEYVTTIREALAYLHDKTSELVQGYGSQYLPASKAAKEHSSYANPDSVFNACSIAQLLIESGSEHLSVLSKILVEPIEPMAAPDMYPIHVGIMRDSCLVGGPQYRCTRTCKQGLCDSIRGDAASGDVRTRRWAPKFGDR